MFRNPSVEGVEVSQLQFSDKVVGSQLCNREQMPQVQFLNKIVDVPVVTQRQIEVQRVQKKIESPRVQHLDKMADVPEV